MMIGAREAQKRVVVQVEQTTAVADPIEGTILSVLGKDYLVTAGFLAEGKSFLFYIITSCLNFAVYLAILQLGVRTFVTELTQSFQGISTKLLPGAVPGVDCAVTYGFGSPNAVTIGFLFGALGQFLAIGALISAPGPSARARGSIPNIMAAVVIMIGLSLVLPAFISACLRSSPSF